MDDIMIEDKENDPDSFVSRGCNLEETVECVPSVQEVFLSTCGQDGFTYASEITETRSAPDDTRGFPELPVAQEMKTDESTLSRNSVMYVVELDHCYCKPKESPVVKTNNLISKLGKDERYWQRRKRNNAAARRSRETKRLREIEMWGKAKKLEVENARLRKEASALMAAIEKNEKKLRLYER